MGWTILLHQKFVDVAPTAQRMIRLITAHSADRRHPSLHDGPPVFRERHSDESSPILSPEELLEQVGAEVYRAASGLSRTFPLVFDDPAATIREIRSLKIVPRFRGDLPEVDVIVAIAASITARVRHQVDLGMRTIAVDVVANTLLPL